MGVCVGDLDARQVERLRAELVESLAANFAYPPFFDFGRGQACIRPLDQAKRDEIVEFVRSANFAQIERVDVSSPELRRYLERFYVRYLDVNPALAPPRLHRRLPELRARVPRVAAEVQRGLVGFASGSAQDFGTRRPRLSWMGSAASSGGSGGEHNTRVLQAVLVRGRSGELVAPAAAPPRRASEPRMDALHPGSSGSLPSGALSSSALSSPSWAPVAGVSDLTVPVPSQEAPGISYTPAPQTSPFAGLEIGSQSTAFAHLSGVSEMPTGPLVAVRADNAGANGHTSSGPEQDLGKSGPRELPPELYRLYGEYLRDMQPEAPASSLPPVTEDADGIDGPTVALPAAPAAQATSAAPAAPMPAAPGATIADDYAISRPYESTPAIYIAQPVQAVQAAAAPPAPGDTRSDLLVFWQLRYQLEAYVRRAARSYGVDDKSGDPSGVLDALRRSRFVDEADMRIAEGILALTDRITRTGAASLEDYRQALTLYLLYHRSHLSE